MKKLIKIGAMSVMSLVALSATVFASTHMLQVGGQAVTGDLNLFSKTTTILNLILAWVTAVIGVIAVIILLYAAFLFMTAGGDEDKIKSAKAYIKYGIIGIVVTILAYSMMTIIRATLAI